jgi:hypothetical protein
MLPPSYTETGHLPTHMLTNWPAFFGQHSGHLGWVLGGLAGVSLYFYRYGAWRSGSALLIRMAVWSMIVFLAGPVLLSNLPFFQQYGGFRLTPPRGDSWSNILGCMIGLILYFRKTGQKPLVLAQPLYRLRRQRDHAIREQAQVRHSRDTTADRNANGLGHSDRR